MVVSAICDGSLRPRVPQYSATGSLRNTGTECALVPGEGPQQTRGAEVLQSGFSGTPPSATRWSRPAPSPKALNDFRRLGNSVTPLCWEPSKAAIQDSRFRRPVGWLAGPPHLPGYAYNARQRPSSSVSCSALAHAVRTSSLRARLLLPRVICASIETCPQDRGLVEAFRGCSCRRCVCPRRLPLAARRARDARSRSCSYAQSAHARLSTSRQSRDGAIPATAAAPINTGMPIHP